MGGKSSQTQTTSQTTTQSPWGPSIAGLTDLSGRVSGLVPQAGLTGAQTGAFSQLQDAANRGNPYAPQIGMLADDLFSGGTDRSGYVTGAHDAYTKALDPIARGDFVDPSQNPALQGYLTTIGNDVSKRVNSMFAGAGRDLSGANVNALSRGIAEGTAPTLLNAYQGERNNQLAAINALYGAGGNTAGLLSNLDQTALGNRTAGVDVSGRALNAETFGPQATLAIEAQKWGIPVEQYAQIAGILGPIGQLGGTATGTGTSHGSSTMSGAQQFANIASGLGNVGKFLWG